MIEKLESLTKEIKYISEINSWIKKYTAEVQENNKYMQFIIEYMDMIPEYEFHRFILLMDEFGISNRKKTSNDRVK